MQNSIVALIFAVFLAGCASEATTGGEQRSQAATTDALVSLEFRADGSVTQSGVLYAGSTVRVVYDVDRMPTCRGEMYGHAAWTVTGLYRVNGSVAQEFLAAGYVPADPKPEIVVHEVGELEIWFRNNNRWGCEAWDSDSGKNFHFEVKPSPGGPGWLGNAFSVISRESCGETFCEGDRVPLDAGYRFGTWERERAIIAKGYFEAYKQSTTDWDNPDLWKQLDVQLHMRFGAEATFASRYVDIDCRVGNNARYGFGVRELDPFGATTETIVDKKLCPSLPLRTSADGQYVEVELEFYITVNGVELHPDGAPVYRGVYADYLSKYAVCLSP